MRYEKPAKIEFAKKKASSSHPSKMPQGNQLEIHSKNMTHLRVLARLVRKLSIQKGFNLSLTFCPLLTDQCTRASMDLADYGSYLIVRRICTLCFTQVNPMSHRKLKNSALTRNALSSFVQRYETWNCLCSSTASVAQS